MSIDAIATSILEKLRTIAQTDTVIGKPITVGDTTLIPVSRVSIGFGLAGNAGKSETSGSGGGLSVLPIAFLVVKDGEARVMTLSDNKDIFAKVVDLVPDALAMFAKT